MTFSIFLINQCNSAQLIRKVLLHRINKNIREHLKLDQQKNRSTVINWFISIQGKHLHSFVIFNIKDFYPSRKEKALIKALKFAESYTDISDEDKRIINQSKISLLFNN